MTVDVVTVLQQPTPIVEVVQEAAQVITIVQQGPQGPSGGGAAGGIEYVQTSPASVWGPIAVPAGLGRRPNVAVYIAGELVLTTVFVSLTEVTISFPSPESGSAVIT